VPFVADPSILVLFIAGFGVSAVIAWRSRIDGGVLWAVGWMALSGAGLAVRLPAEVGIAGAAGLSTVFAVLMLAGMLRHADRPVPRPFMIGATVYGILEVVVVVGGRVDVGVVMKELTDPALFVAAAVVAARMPANVRRGLGCRLLPFAFVLMAAEAVNDGIVVLGHSVSGWRYIALPVLGIQALATGELRQMTMMSSQRVLRATLGRYRAIAESARDAILEVGLDGRIHYVSPSFRDVLGWTPDDVLGRNIMELAHPEAEPIAEQELRRFQREGEVAPVVARARHRDGSWRWIESSSTAATQDGETRLILVCRDVSERRRVEEAMRDSERRFGMLAERSGAFIAELGPDARILYLSPNVERIFGIRPEEMVGHTLYELSARAGAAGATGLRPDDTLDDVVARGAIPRIRRQADAEGRMRQLELELVTYAQDGAPRRALIVGRDVTERMLLEEQLRETQKLESLGVLAGGIAHDFNNLLAIMLGNASLARATLAPSAREQRHLLEIESAAERAADLTHQLLSYAGRGSIETAPLELGSLVTGMIDLLASAIPADVRLAFELAPDLPAVEADAGELQQIVLNLVTNASEATGGSGVVSIGTRLVVVGDEPEPSNDAFVGEPPAPGRYVALAVRDAGCGMDDATRARIFDPFFSTKGMGRGLGLAAIQGIVRSHGGGMRLETAVGRGSRFEVLLPVSERPLAGAPARRGPLDAEAPGVHGTVLVVDDEDGVRFAASLALEYGGYRVLTAANGAEAVSLFGTHGGEVVAVVLDKSMPVMGGEETLRELRSRRADLPVVLTSGYTGSLPRAGSYDGPLPHVLPKPYRSEALVDAVNAAVRGDAPATA